MRVARSWAAAAPCGADPGAPADCSPAGVPSSACRLPILRFRNRRASTAARVYSARSEAGSRGRGPRTRSGEAWRANAESLVRNGVSVATPSRRVLLIPKVLSIPMATLPPTCVARCGPFSLAVNRPVAPLYAWLNPQIDQKASHAVMKPNRRGSGFRFQF